MNCTSRIVLTAFALGLATVPAHAETVQPSAQPSKESAPAVAGGLVVVKDPATGKFVQPSAADMQKLLETSRPSSTTDSVRQPEAIRGVGGAPGIKLGSDSMVYMVVNKSPDGQLRETCVTGEKAAQAQLNPTSTTQATSVQQGASDVK